MAVIPASLSRPTIRATSSADGGPSAVSGASAASGDSEASGDSDVSGDSDAFDCGDASGAIEAALGITAEGLGEAEERTDAVAVADAPELALGDPDGSAARTVPARRTSAATAPAPRLAFDAIVTTDLRCG